jgi:hypothetical protein
MSTPNSTDRGQESDPSESRPLKKNENEVGPLSELQEMRGAKQSHNLAFEPATSPQICDGEVKTL